jgi:hypothetical protein
VRHGREGRAITMESLAANVGMPGHSRELTTALRSLAARGLIIRAGADPIPGAPVAFRLSRPISVRQDTKPKSAARSRPLLENPLNELTLSRSQNSPLWARTARSNPTAERVIESLRARVPNQRLSYGAVSRTIAIEIVDNHPVISRPVTSLRGWSRFWPRDPVTSMACQEEDLCLTSCRSPR